MKAITAEEFDRKFDDGEDISDYVEWSKTTRPGLEPRHVDIDFPAWIVDRLDLEAKRLGITPQSLVKIWIAERLEAGDGR